VFFGPVFFGPVFFGPMIARLLDMSQIHEGQCGLCLHFGENHDGPHNTDLTQIRASHEAPDTILDDCGHPKHAALHLKVTPISGCDGFESAAS
jgi:hypothetical protein